MGNIINVTIRDRIAKNFREREAEYICGNSGFIVEFDFDEEWDALYAKTARFKYNDTYKDVVFNGNQCEIPIIENTHQIKVGVFAGNLQTTTSAIIMAKKSILCGSGVPAAPADDVYNQIMEMLSDCVEGSEGATFTPIATEVADGVELSWENNQELPNPKPVTIRHGVDGKPGADGKPGSDGLPGKDGQDGYTPVKGVDYFDGAPGKDGYTPKKGVDYFDGKDGVDGKPGSNGRDGVDGITPHIGNNGNWYIGNTDTGKPSQGSPGKEGAAGKDGNNGQPGKDGVSVYHVWEGTVLKVTSASGTSSADLRGAPGAPGKDGYTPVKNVDYFDGKDGQNGSPGKDGTSVTVKSVSASNADGGSNVVTFSDGKTLTVKNGSKGSTGDKGDDGVGIESVEQTFTPTADDAYNVITMKLTDGKTKQFSVKNGSKGSTGATGKTAYEYARDGGYTGTEAQFAEKLAAEFPTTLPNPNGIHINGTYYDGSEHVSVNIEGGSGSADMGASGGEPGYVKRREFYDEPDKTVADNVSVSSGQYSWISHDIVADHKTATVVYDGVTYECSINFKESITEYGDESYFYIGNWSNSAPEYPFIIFGYINNDAATVNVGSGTHTISVTLNAVLKKIDKKFLPDDIGGETTTKTLFYERDSDADGGIDDYGYIPALEAGVTYEVEWGGEVYTDTAKKVADVLGVSPDDTVTLPDGTEYQPYDDVVWGDLSYFVGGEPTMPIRMECMTDGSTMLFNMSGVDGVRHVKIYVVEKAPSGGGVSQKVDTKILSDVLKSSMSNMGVYVDQPDIYGLKSIPATATVWLDSVRYADLQVLNIPGYGDVFGNLSLMNALMGTSFENTGEPFLAAFVGLTSVLFMFPMDTSDTYHNVCLSVPEENIEEAFKKYLPDIPVVDFIELGLSRIVNGSVQTLTLSDDWYSKLENIARQGSAYFKFAANCNITVSGTIIIGGDVVMEGLACTSLGNFGDNILCCSFALAFADNNFHFVVRNDDKILHAWLT